MSNAEGVRIKAPRRWGVGRGFPPPHWGRGMWSCPSPENFSIAGLKIVSFDAFCVVF